jgi:hypothetical protein
MMVLLFLWTIMDDEGSALTAPTITIRPNVHDGRQFRQVERNNKLVPYASTALFAAASEDNNDDDDNDNDNDDDDTSSSPTVSTLERLKISGVSVSPNGFHVILQRNPVASDEEGGRYIPIKVTNDIQDAFAATTPESLTLCQLLSGVDMAGVILPPELLSKIVVYHIEEKIQQQQQHTMNDQEGQQLQLSPQEQKIVEKIQESLPDNQESYKDSHVWFQSRMSIPQITLDQLTLIPDGRNNWKCRLDCAVPDLKDRLVLEVQKEILSSLLYQYDTETSLMFTCIALALRYRAPIVLEVPSQRHDSTTTTTTASSFATTLQRLEREFPKRTTVDRLQQQSTRVARNIERGFEIHKLQGALRVAMKLGDQRAVEKIRAKLDEYDSMDSLPTTTAATTTTSTMGDTKNNSIVEDDDDRLDDLDKNILQ